MTDDLQQPTLEPQPELNPELQVENVTTIPDPAPSQTKESKRNLWIIVIASVGVICIGSIICASIIILGATKINAEKAPVESVLNSFMTYMVVEDVDSAYELFSPRAQRQIPISEIEEMLEGNNYILYEGYESLTVQNLNVSVVSNTNENLPQGTVAKVTGTINYEDDIQGTFTGVLEKVNGNWEIDGFHITVPPDKFQP
jgi:hypothetical protein